MERFKLILSDTQREILAPDQVGYFKIKILDDTKSFMIIDSDNGTEDLGLAVWFSNQIFYDPLRFDSYLLKQHVQKVFPLVVSISNINTTSGFNIKVNNGTYFFNIQNMTGSEKAFTIKELQS